MLAGFRLPRRPRAPPYECVLAGPPFPELIITKWIGFQQSRRRKGARSASRRASYDIFVCKVPKYSLGPGVILRDLRRRRNRIAHHRFIPASSHRVVLGEALKFIGYSLKDELGED